MHFEKKKILLKDFNYIELRFGNLFIIFTLVIILYVILSILGKFDITHLTNVTPTQARHFLICGILIFIVGLGINYLLSNQDATSIVPMLTAGTLIFTLLFGCIVYSERITLRKVIASVFAIMAIIILFYEK